MLVAEALDDPRERFNGEQSAKPFSSIKSGLTLPSLFTFDPRDTPRCPPPQASPDYDLLANYETHLRLGTPENYALAKPTPGHFHASIFPVSGAPKRSNGLDGNNRVFRDGFQSLVALSLTSQRLRAIAQAVLFKAPVLSVGRGGRWIARSPLYLFARTLLEHPYLSRWTTSLRINMPRQWAVGMDTGGLHHSARLEIVNAFVTVIDTVDCLDEVAKEECKWQLRQLRPLPFCALILCLLPNLQQLNIDTASGVSDSPFMDLFWESSKGTMGEERRAHTLSSLAKCPGLANLTHVKTTSWITAFQSPLSNIPSLTSLDMSLRNQVYPEFHQPMLNRLKHLRLRCNIDDLPYDLAGIQSRLEAFLDKLTVILPSLTKLKTLEMYTAEQPNHSKTCCTRSILARAKYSSLARHCLSLAPTLLSLELPRGWWIWPGHESLSLATPPGEITLPLNDGTQPGAYTGSILDLSPFTALESLVTHSTAIIAMGAHDAELADPRETLPFHIKHITVYGAHDGLWAWVNDIYGYRGTHFPHLRSLTLLRDDAVDLALGLCGFRALKGSHAKLWKRISESTLRLCGDV